MSLLSESSYMYTIYAVYTVNHYYSFGRHGKMIPVKNKLVNKASIKGWRKNCSQIIVSEKWKRHILSVYGSFIYFFYYYDYQGYQTKYEFHNLRMACRFPIQFKHQKKLYLCFFFCYRIWSCMLNHNCNLFRGSKYIWIII